MGEGILTQVPLGKKTAYVNQYDPRLLAPVPRALNRAELSLGDALPFQGADIWNAYELSWLNHHNKPSVALAEFIFPCDGEFLVESKSFKLYLNSFNNSPFDSMAQVQEIIQKDLEAIVGSSVQVALYALNSDKNHQIATLEGEVIDDLEVHCDLDRVRPASLCTQPKIVDERLVSHLLKSNCLVTGQPDWGSVQIQYRGPKIDRAGLLKYIVSFRNHNEFHEHCVERMFMDISRQCQCEQLTVYARYTRRGGLDINPIRSSDPVLVPPNVRLMRQ